MIGAKTSSMVRRRWRRRPCPSAVIVRRRPSSSSVSFLSCAWCCIILLFMSLAQFILQAVPRNRSDFVTNPSRIRARAKSAHRELLCNATKALDIPTYCILCIFGSFRFAARHRVKLKARMSSNKQINENARQVDSGQHVDWLIVRLFKMWVSLFC